MGRRRSSGSESEGYSRSSKTKKKKKDRRRERSRTRSRTRSSSSESSRYSSSRSKHKKSKKKHSSRSQRSHSHSPSRHSRSHKERSRRSRSRSTDRTTSRRSRSPEVTSSRYRTRSRSDSRSRYGNRRSRSRSVSGSRDYISRRRSRSRSNSLDRSRRKVGSLSLSSRRRSRSRSGSGSRGTDLSRQASQERYKTEDKILSSSEKVELRRKALLAAMDKGNTSPSTSATNGGEVGLMSQAASDIMSLGCMTKSAKDFADSVASIESDKFVPAAFKSSGQRVKLEPSEKLQSSHDDAIFGSLSTSGFTIKPDLDVKPVAMDAASIMHPSLFCDVEEKMEKWVDRLSHLRKRKLEGEAMQC